MAAIITPVGTLASRGKALFTASLSKDDKGKPDKSPTFYARVLFTHAALSSKEWIAVMNEAFDIGREKFGKNFDAMWKEGGIRSPLRRDVATKGYDPAVFGGFLQVKAWEDNPPAKLSRVAGPDGKNPLPITDPAEFRPGTEVRLSLRRRAYGEVGGKFSPGIAFDMLAIQKIGNGTPLVGGGGDPTEGLDALPEEVEADLAALLKM